ncbi:MAG TPA: hypothetical protein VKB93_07955 [Thermoanaerobaculia bacterium]|nr:hypothetical protein [Thermoanaerobaculia bacterium]
MKEEAVARFAWKIARLAMRFLGSVMLAIAISIGTAVMLLFGVNTVLSFAGLGVAFVVTLIKTVVLLVVLFAVFLFVAAVTFATMFRATAKLAGRRVAFARRWRLFLVRAYIRVRPPSEQWLRSFGTVLALAIVLEIACVYLLGIRLKPAMQLPTRVPLGRIGRDAASLRVSTLADAGKYADARRDQVVDKADLMVLSTLGDRPVGSRCGNVAPLRTAEALLVAELLVDLTSAPPLVKREYLVTEEQLTRALAAMLALESGSVRLDCVKLHRDYIRFFTTAAGIDGEQHGSLGVSVAKTEGRLRMILEEMSFGRATFQVGWLGIGVANGREGLSDFEGGESFAGILRALDSRIFSIEVFEGYARIVTWRLPSVVAARAAVDVGSTQRTVAQRVEPRADAGSSGVVRAGDLVYVLQARDEWLYGCSEVSGKFGWLPKAAFTSLEQPIKAAPRLTAHPFLRATPYPPDAFSPNSFSFAVLGWQCTVSAEGAGRCRNAKNTWRFSLPVDDGRINVLYVSADEPLVFTYLLTDEESDWGRVTGIAPRARRPAWTTQVGGLNLATPVASADSVFIAALAFVASVNRTTGSIEWRHDTVYDGSGRTKIQLAVENNTVRVTADSTAVCYDSATGAVVACPAARVE